MTPHVAPLRCAVTLDLRAAGRATGIALSGVVLSDQERTSAIDEWRGRMVNEHISARVFAQLSRR